MEPDVDTLVAAALLLLTMYGIRRQSADVQRLIDSIARNTKTDHAASAVEHIAPTTTTVAPASTGILSFAGTLTTEFLPHPADITVAPSGRPPASEVGLPSLSNLGLPSVGHRDAQYAAARHWYGQSASTPLPLRAATVASTS